MVVTVYTCMNISRDYPAESKICNLERVCKTKIFAPQLVDMISESSRQLLTVQTGSLFRLKTKHFAWEYFDLHFQQWVAFEVNNDR